MQYKKSGPPQSTRRPIDRTVSRTTGVIGNAMVLVKKTKIKTWQAILLIIFVGGIVTALISAVALKIQTESGAVVNQARLFLDPPTDSVEINDNFDINVVLDTGGDDSVVVAKADLAYDPTAFSLQGAPNTTNSAFAAGNTCVYQSKPCQIINTATPGQISITLAKPSPGVNPTTSGLVAVLTFKALKAVAPTADNITIDQSKSAVIKDTNTGTDILNAVAGTRITVTVTPSAPTVTLSANPTSIQTGQSSMLIWNATQGGPVASCTASGAWSGSKATSGTATVSPTTVGANIYTLTCTGTGGTAAQSTTVTVSSTPVPPTASLSANPTTIKEGKSSTLTWNSTNATSCSGSGSTGGTPSGTADVSPTATTTYTVTCAGPGGEASQNTTVTVVKDDDDDDKEKPKKIKFAPMPSLLNKYRGSLIWWDITRGKVKHYEYKFNGVTRKTTRKSFVIPADTRRGFYTLRIKAVPKSDKYKSATKTITIFVR